MKKFILIFLTIHTTFSLYSCEQRSPFSRLLVTGNLAINTIETEILLSDLHKYTPEKKVLLEKMIITLAESGYAHTHGAIVARQLEYGEDKDPCCCHRMLLYFGLSDPTNNEKRTNSREFNLNMGERLLDNSLKLSEIHRNLAQTKEKHS